MVATTLAGNSAASPLGMESFPASQPAVGRATSIFLVGLQDSQRLSEPNLDASAAHIGWSFIARLNDAGIPPTASTPSTPAPPSTSEPFAPPTPSPADPLAFANAVARPARAASRVFQRATRVASLREATRRSR